MSEYDAAFIYMPLEQAQLFFGRDDDVDMIEVNLADPDAIDRLQARRSPRRPGRGAIVTDWRDRNRSYFTALQVERNVMRLILMLIVAIAAMNIISGLIMLVKNKSRDIAILRTMGASQGAILRIFFMSGASIGACGHHRRPGAGHRCSASSSTRSRTSSRRSPASPVFNADTYFLSRIPAKIEWARWPSSPSGRWLMSFLATLPPAWRASRLDPVEALRYE